jgi:hypothetical protein
MSFLRPSERANATRRPKAGFPRLKEKSHAVLEIINHFGAQVFHPLWLTLILKPCQMSERNNHTLANSCTRSVYACARPFAGFQVSHRFYNLPMKSQESRNQRCVVNGAHGFIRSVLDFNLFATRSEKDGSDGSFSNTCSVY